MDRPADTELASHFAFGRNWESFARLLTEARIAAAEASVAALAGDVAGRRVLDIGSGSGLFALALLRRGARELVAIDLDPDSVATTRATLTRFAPDGPWQVAERSVLTLLPTSFGSFDLVYSWGVLHHTGAMEAAIRRAAACVAPGGALALALYTDRPTTAAWRRIKRWYSRRGPRTQWLARRPFVWATLLATASRGRNPWAAIAAYRTRGMEFFHDVHDWLGGYPYEAMAPARMHALAAELGFTVEWERLQPKGLGLLGAGNDEYRLRRRA